MRIFAAIGVVMIHVSDISTFSGLFLNAAARFSVPVFVMISGYYMLAHKPDGRRIAQKCGKLFGLMLFWSGIYYGYNLLNGIHTYTGVRSLLTWLLTMPVHLWYIYAIITLYLFTPLFYVFVTAASRGEYLYALTLTFLLGSPIVILLRSGWVPLLAVILDKMKAAYLLGMVFLYLLGGYLRKYDVDRAECRGAIYLLGVVGTAVSIAGTALLKDSGAPAELLLSFFAPNVMAEGVMVFLFCKRFFRRRPVRSEKVSGMVRVAAKGTLGIYLIHPLVMQLLQPIPMPDSTGLTIILRTLLVFSVSAVLVTVLRQIPVLKRIAG